MIPSSDGRYFINSIQQTLKKRVIHMAFEPKSTQALIRMSDIPERDLSKIDADYQYADPKDGEEVAVIHTNYGDISFRFLTQAAPMAAENFKALAKAGRYDGTIFHRVIDGFMIQGGDYTHFDGTGGESAFGESFGYEVCEHVRNSEGSVAMAHSSLPDSNGSQFYINQVDNHYLDGSYTVFGQVFDGMDVVEAIASVATDYADKPLSDVVIESVEITAY